MGSTLEPKGVLFYFVELLFDFPLLVEFLVTSIFLNLDQVNSVHPECRFHLEIQEEETKCAELLRTQTEKYKGKVVTG